MKPHCVLYTVKDTGYKTQSTLYFIHDVSPCTLECTLQDTGYTIHPTVCFTLYRTHDTPNTPFPVLKRIHDTPHGALYRIQDALLPYCRCYIFALTAVGRENKPQFILWWPQYTKKTNHIAFTTMGKAECWPTKHSDRCPWIRLPEFFYRPVLVVLTRYSVQCNNKGCSPGFWNLKSSYLRVWLLQNSRLNFISWQLQCGQAAISEEAQMAANTIYICTIRHDA